MNTIMPGVVPAPRRKLRRKRWPATQAAGPTLVAASFDAEASFLTLTFDRNVNAVEGYLASETIAILDGPNGTEYLNASDVEGLGTATLSIVVYGNAPWVGAGVTMSCGAGTGIVSADTGEPWAGVTDLSLPLV